MLLRLLILGDSTAAFTGCVVLSTITIGKERGRSAEHLRDTSMER